MGKYMPLTQWLLKCSTDSVKLSFFELEDILGFKLPNSAFVHSRWWMNDWHHSQAQGWLDAGYKTLNSNEPIVTQTVEFIKISTTKNKQFNKNTPVKSEAITTKKIKEQDEKPITKEIEAQDEQSITKEIKGNTITIGNYLFAKTIFTIYEKDIASPFLQYDRHIVNDLLNKKHYAYLRYEVEKSIRSFYMQEYKVL